MTKNEVKTRVEKVFSDLFGEDTLERMRSAEKIFFSANEAKDQPAALELLDSLDQIEFSMALEDEFDLSVTDGEAGEITSLASAIEKIAEHVGATAE